MKNKICAFSMIIFLLIASTDVMGKGNTDSLNNKFDRLFNEAISQHSAGCSAGVFDSGKVSYEGYFGMANVKLKRQIDSDTQFRLASNSKQFTATIIALLAENKYLSLRDPLSKYFPKLPKYAELITLTDLIQHTSGLRDYFVLSELTGIPPSESFTKEYALKLLFNQKSTNFRPGSKFSYSNAGYILLAEIVEKITNKSFRQIANEMIFKPLTMHHSFFDDLSTLQSNNIAMGYLPNNIAFESKMGMVGAGGMVSTINDLAKWDYNFYQNKLSSSTDLIETLTTPGKLNDGTKHQYSFGLEVLKYGPYEMQYHGGEMEGTLTEFIRIPEKQMSIALLCNSNEIDSFGLAMSMLKLKVPLNEKVKNLAGAKSENTKSYQITYKNNPLDINLQQYVGFFWDELGLQKNQITMVDEGLMLLGENGRKNKLGRVSEHKFKILDVPYKGIVNFSLNSSNKWNMEIDFDSGQFVRNLSQFEQVNYDSEKIRNYLGSFYSEELNIHYTITLNNKELNLSFAELSEVKLNLLMDEVFYYVPFYDQNTLSFQYDSDNKVVGFLLNSPRAKKHIL